MTSPISYSPVLRRVRANSRAGLGNEHQQQPQEGEDGRWRPRSFESFFQEQDHTKLLEDIRPHLKASPLGSASSSSIPTRRGTVDYSGSLSDEDVSSASREARGLPPRQLDFGAPREPSDASHINHSASASLYQAALSMSATGTPTRLSHSVSTDSAPLPLPTVVEFFPLHKSISDGGIDVKGHRDRRSASPLKLLAVRNHMETPGRRASISMEGSGGYPGTEEMRPLEIDSASDYDSERGSDYESEGDENKERRLSESWSPTGGKDGPTASPNVSALRRRVMWRRNSSPAPVNRSKSSSPSYLSRNVWWIILALVVDMAVLFSLGYMHGASYQKVTLQDFGGFLSEYPIKDTASEKWTYDPIQTCREYVTWLQARAVSVQENIEEIERNSPEIGEHHEYAHAFPRLSQLPARFSRMRGPSSFPGWTRNLRNMRFRKAWREAER